MNEPEIRAWVDGSCSGNPGPGGSAAILNYKNKWKIVIWAIKKTTNNRAELEAAIYALQALKKRSNLTIYSDSTYLVDGASVFLPKWKLAGLNSRANSDLWKIIDKFKDKHEINWKWTRGHAGNPYNNWADALAGWARDQAKEGQEGKIYEGNEKDAPISFNGNAADLNDKYSQYERAILTGNVLKCLDNNGMTCYVVRGKVEKRKAQRKYRNYPIYTINELTRLNQLGSKGRRKVHNAIKTFKGDLVAVEKLEKT